MIEPPEDRFLARSKNGRFVPHGHRGEVAMKMGKSRRRASIRQRPGGIVLAASAARAPEPGRAADFGRFVETARRGAEQADRAVECAASRSSRRYSIRCAARSTSAAPRVAGPRLPRRPSVPRPATATATQRPAAVATSPSTRPGRRERAVRTPSSGSSPPAADRTGAKPVGQARERKDPNRPPPVAPIFEQPGVLTEPRDTWIVEPSLQYSTRTSS